MASRPFLARTAEGSATRGTGAEQMSPTKSGTGRLCWKLLCPEAPGPSGPGEESDDLATCASLQRLTARSRSGFKAIWE